MVVLIGDTALCGNVDEFVGELILMSWDRTSVDYLKWIYLDLIYASSKLCLFPVKIVGVSSSERSGVLIGFILCARWWRLIHCIAPGLFNRLDLLFPELGFDGVSLDLQAVAGLLFALLFRFRFGFRFGFRFVFYCLGLF